MEQHSVADSRSSLKTQIHSSHDRRCEPAVLDHCQHLIAEISVAAAEATIRHLQDLASPLLLSALGFAPDFRARWITVQLCETAQ